MRFSLPNKKADGRQSAPANSAVASMLSRSASNASAQPDDDDDDDDYDRQRRRRLQSTEQEDGWRTEMCRYEDDPAVEVNKDMDLVMWWQVRQDCRSEHHMAVDVYADICSICLTYRTTHPFIQCMLGSHSTSYRLLVPLLEPSASSLVASK